MKDEYDFTKAERGKFHRLGVRLNQPIYLDEEVQAFVEKIAQKKETDMSSVVNTLLRNDMRLSDIME
ncbi:MAG: hypothetical protein C4527_04070 [Candidatus Omnitrophota bacterium]|jgi:hypothetical protein|nr:MAG: hypothetical protein C4527_04070 [Candidatus Omnitrophota bacterium]